MSKGRLYSWRIPCFVGLLVCFGVIAFCVYQSWTKGRLPDTGVLDLSLVQPVQVSGGHRNSLQPNETGEHYEFFSLLDNPAPVRPLPNVQLAENPAIAMKNHRIVQPQSSKYAIQVSSFKKVSEAQNLVQQLNGQGYRAVVVNESVGGNSWYRVRIEGGSQREYAESLQASIQKKTGLKGVVVSQ